MRNFSNTVFKHLDSKYSNHASTGQEDTIIMFTLNSCSKNSLLKLRLCLLIIFIKLIKLDSVKWKILTFNELLKSFRQPIEY